MAEEMKTPEQKNVGERFGRFGEYWRNRILTGFWERFFGKKLGRFTQEAYEKDKLEEKPTAKELITEFRINNQMIAYLNTIEEKWEEGVDLKLFPYKDVKRGEETIDHIKYSHEPDTDKFTDIYRKIEYFRDARFVKAETEIFKFGGTIKLLEDKNRFSKDDEDKIVKNAQETINESQKIIKELESKKGKTEEEIKKLEEAKTNLENAKNLLEEIKQKQFKYPYMKKVKVSEINFPFLNGKQEGIVAFGAQNLKDMRTVFNSLANRIDHFASALGVAAGTRNPINQLLKEIQKILDRIYEIETKHFHKLESEILPSLTHIKSLEIDIESKFRPDPNLIRFPHTYKIIKQFASVEVDTQKFKVEEGGKEIEVEVPIAKMVYFNSDKNPYVNELKEIDEQIKNINKKEIDNKIDQYNKKIILYNKQITTLNKLKNEIEKNNITYILSQAKDYLKKLFNITKEKDIIRNKKYLISKIPQIIDTITRKKSSILTALDNAKKQLQGLQELISKKIEIEDIIRISPKNPNFVKFEGEIDYGLDENGWPLEVEKVNNLQELLPVGEKDPGIWIVLLDKWWYELSQNPWHESVIKGKPGGEEIWKSRVVNGVLKHGIRIVNEAFVGDLEPLEKVMFIFNEWDAFRDDYRDGRYHPHSKTSMCYIIAGCGMGYEIGKGMVEKESNTPTEPINLKINTRDKETRIRFRPIYKTDTEYDKNKYHNIKVGEVLPDFYENISEDERKVSRVYDLEIEGGHILRGKVRKPTQFNPAFDRAALGTEFIHWGRMYYYETPDSINRWSENPFPHVTTRGIAKYLIDLTLRPPFGPFSFEDARQILKNNVEIGWDFGIRHYGEPFIKDPLGDAVGRGGQLEGLKGKEHL